MIRRPVVGDRVSIGWCGESYSALVLAVETAFVLVEHVTLAVLPPPYGTPPREWLSMGLFYDNSWYIEWDTEWVLEGVVR